MSVIACVLNTSRRPSYPPPVSNLSSLLMCLAMFLRCPSRPAETKSSPWAGPPNF